MLREYLINLGKLAGMPSRTLPGIGDTADDVLADAGLMGRAGMLEEAPADALDPHARNSALQRAAGESDTALRRWLRGRWDTWKACGSTDGLRAALLRLGFVAEIYTTLDLKLDFNFVGFGGHQGFFFVLLRAPLPIAAAAQNTWDGGQLWNGGETWGGLDMGWPGWSNLHAALRRWRPMGTSPRFVALELDENDPVTITNAGFGGGPILVVPVGETWEIDPATGARVREFYHYSYLLERVT